MEKLADVKHFDSKIGEVINSCRYLENPVSKKKWKEGRKEGNRVASHRGFEPLLPP